MERFEININGDLIKTLGDMVMTFAYFMKIASYSKGIHTTVKISNDTLVQSYINGEGTDEGLNRFEDYIRTLGGYDKISDFKNGDYTLIKISNSDYLKNLFGFDYTVKYLKKQIEELYNDKTSSKHRLEGIEKLKHRLFLVENPTPGNTLFDELIYIIINTKNIRLQLE